MGEHRVGLVKVALGDELVWLREVVVGEVGPEVANAHTSLPRLRQMGQNVISHGKGKGGKACLLWNEFAANRGSTGGHDPGRLPRHRRVHSEGFVDDRRQVCQVRNRYEVDVVRFLEGRSDLVNRFLQLAELAQEEGRSAERRG